MKKNLNRTLAQTEAVSHVEGPMMVLAGPGSGKTSVIVERTAALIREHEIPPSAILVVTFSRMAAEEMKKRFLTEIRKTTTEVVFGTFHSVFFRILSQAYGLDFGNILTEEEKVRLVRSALLDAGGERMPEGDYVRDILREISLVKGNRMDLQHFHSVSCPDELFHKVFRTYAESCRSRRKLDFDDMLVDCYELLTRREDILESWRQRFRYILVDEFQDINPLQYDILRLLASPANNLFVVGDDDQSIYHFRGASPAIMMNFEKDFSPCRRVQLDVNFRCSGNIVETASFVIRNNRNRFAKKLTTPNPEGSPVGVCLFRNAEEEYRYLIRELRRRIDNGEKPEDTAILFRTNQEAEDLVRRLLDTEIPFYLRDHLPNLFDHWIAGDIFAYLELSRHLPFLGRTELLRVMNRPDRYFSREAVLAAGIGGGEQGLLVDPAALRRYFSGRDWMEERLNRLLKDLKTLSGLPPFAAVNFIRAGIGYEDWLKEYASQHRQNREELLQILVRLQESARGVSSLDAWKKAIQTYEDNLQEQSRKQKENPQGVTLATLHACKGLEYRKVYICNVNEEIIPYRKALLPETIEEERRLFYVGMTRAKENLTLCLVRKRFEKTMRPSRFLYEAGYSDS